MRLRLPRTIAALAASATLLAACGADDTAPTDEVATEVAEPTGETLTVYSGRGEDLVGSVLADFEDASGIDVEVRYGDTAQLAALLLEEGDATPADVYWAQDAGALGAIASQGLFAELPADVLDRVDAGNRAEDDTWTGVTGRARTIVHSTERVADDELPASVLQLTEPQWLGRVGWAPTNGSFQSFVTAMREVLGEDVTRGWLEGMIANDVQVYENNSSQVEAVGRGEIDLGLVNHYYLLRFLAEDPDFPAANHFPAGDVGSLLNVAGVGVLAASDSSDAAEQLVAYLLSDEVQTFFAGVTDEAEYPLVDGIDPSDALPTLAEIDAPEVDLASLSDLEGTLDLLTEVGALR
jgi:iron(III) transport system substrate-binding protein